MHDRKILTTDEIEKLLEILKNRFLRNSHLHRSLQWEEVHSALLHDASAMWSISQMEATGGEPDVVLLEESSSTLIFVDVAKETPKGRKSLCYDREALENRKANKPENSAMGLAKDMGIELLTEEEYRKVQKMEMLDLKTSSWVKTPEAIRKLGGALFCDRRYNTVFTYHNGADSYYGSRGFRGKLRIERT